MNYLEYYKIITESTYFFVIVIIIFDIVTSVTFKLGFVNEILKQEEVVFFSLLSINFAFFDSINKFLFNLTEKY